MLFNDRFFFCPDLISLHSLAVAILEICLNECNELISKCAVCFYFFVIIIIIFCYLFLLLDDFWFRIVARSKFSVTFNRSMFCYLTRISSTTFSLIAVEAVL